jgi:hypothetical protein
MAVSQKNLRGILSLASIGFKIHRHDLAYLYILVTVLEEMTFYKEALFM